MIPHIIYFIFILIGVRWNISIIYILFALMSSEILFRYKYKIYDKILIVGIYSIILPDNYVTELLFILYACTYFLNKKHLNLKKTKYAIFLILFIVNAVFSTIINFVAVPNVLFSLISFAPFLIFLCLIGNGNQHKNIRFLNYIDQIFYIEFIATIFNFMFYHDLLGDDWSIGTFGRNGGQQAQLFIIASFFMIFYFYHYMNHKECRRSLIKAILSLIIVLSTNCWTLLLMLTMGIGISYLITLNRKKVIFIVIATACIPAGIVVAGRFLPELAINSVVRAVSDRSYFDYRFHKLVVYSETFAEIPGKDLKFALVGNGVGYYNSRAALICTGEYVGFYSKLFDRSISDYTQKYIYDYVKLAHDYGGSDYGSVLARPYASIMALMGECGYIGLGLYVVIMVLLLKRKSNAVKTLIIIWLSFCLVENYFEYPKVLMMLYVVMTSLESKKWNNGRSSKNDK